MKTSAAVHAMPPPPPAPARPPAPFAPELDINIPFEQATSASAPSAKTIPDWSAPIRTRR